LKPRPRRRARTIAAAVTALALTLILADQLGIRRLSGADFPSPDPLAPALRTWVETLASPAWGGRVPGTPENEEAARYLADELRKAGVPPLPSAGGSYLSPISSFNVGRGSAANVIGYLPGTGGPAAGTVILGAHFDHLGKTRDGIVLGADDNASSVAVILGALPALVADTARRSPVLIIFFNTEEVPYFGTAAQGSEHFLKAPPPEVAERASIRVALILDLIGGVVWRHAADTVFACGAEKGTGLPAVVDRVPSEEGLAVRRLGIHMVERMPGYPRMPVSDYNAFRAHRIPFLFLSSGRTPRYHAPSDLPATLYYDRMARTSRWIARFAAALDADPASVVFAEDGADLARDRDTMRWAIDAAASPFRWIPGTSPITAIRLLADRRRLEAMAEPGHALDAADVGALERASFRMQCLLYSYPACFTF
jgi:hypothetical protein